MAYWIDPFYAELHKLISSGKDKVSSANAIIAKYGLEKSSDAMVSAYKRAHRRKEVQDRLELRKATVGETGNVISETYGSPGQPLPANADEFELTAFTTSAYSDKIWGRFVNVKHLIGLTPEEMEKELKRVRPKAVKPRKSVPGSGTGVALLADFHLGAAVTELLATPDFSYKHAARMLREIARKINAKKYDKVYVFLIGDFIESFTGLNHINAWKGLAKGAYGIKGIIFAHEVLMKHFYSKVNNLVYCGFVSGNHDRTTSNNKEDQEGQVALAMQYLFNKDMKHVESEWSPLLISKDIDNINYICMHGHLPISDKEISKIILRYGKQKKYNVVAKGHKHTRVTKKYYSQSIIKFEDIDYVHQDELEYRGITVPPLFTGNFYSESLGFTSTAGFTLIENNGRGRINHTDFTL